MLLRVSSYIYECLLLHQNTVYVIAPEIVMNEGITKKADIWGLGLSALVL